MADHFTRRNFLCRTVASATGMILTSGVSASPGPSQSPEYYDIMGEVRKYRKIDAYATSNFSKESLRSQITFADRFGIEKLFIAMPMTERKYTPDEFREMNDAVHKASREYTGRVVGQFTFNPQYPKESLDEISRSVDRGMVGTRVYHRVKINHPLFYPIVEKFIALRMILFVHGEHQLGVGGYRMKYDAGKAPMISTPDDFVDIARRYPEAMFQYPHLGGGGEWEYACKSFRNHPNIYVDLGGSNNQENIVDFAVAHLGVDRLFFGSDNSFYQGVGKIMSSNLDEQGKQKVFFDNYNAILKKGGYHVG